MMPEMRQRKSSEERASGREQSACCVSHSMRPEQQSRPSASKVAMMPESVSELSTRVMMPEMLQRKNSEERAS